MTQKDECITEFCASDVDRKAAQVTELLATSARDHGRIVYASSLGAESIVLTDIIFTQVPHVEVLTIDTGRLHEETRALLSALEDRYRRRIRVVSPASRDVEEVVSAYGINGFYADREARIACCRARKVEPFRRAIRDFGAWVTGIRREQSMIRAQGRPVEWDGEHGIWKISPLLDWSGTEIWRYIRARRLPYNSLYDRQYLSIGCAPCTRAVLAGEHERSGRWWWEESGERECGLHPKIRAVFKS